MKLYRIENDYIDYLRSFDDRVQENKYIRPYVGVILQVNNCDYYVPLASPKKKHTTMKNTIDFRKIAGGALGAINFNNMIPATNSVLTIIDIDNYPDVKYRRLMQNQVKCLKRDWNNIVKVANKLYRLVIKDDCDLSPNDRRIKDRCCDFLLLEEALRNYK